MELWLARLFKVRQPFFIVPRVVFVSSRFERYPRPFQGLGRVGKGLQVATMTRYDAQPGKGDGEKIRASELIG